MEKTDFLKPENQVTVTIWSPSDSKLYQSTDTGFHNIESAIRETLDKARLEMNPEDCVFEVANNTTGVAHRYRINAHGNLKLIV